MKKINVLNKRICSIENECLIIEQHEIRTTQIQKKSIILSDTIKSKSCYPLTEATYEEIKKARENRKSLFVMKSHGKLSYAYIPQDLSLLSTNMLGNHVCANSDTLCKYLKFCSPSEGGCYRLGHEKHIEDIPEIIEGYETFGTNEDAFPVALCTRCEYVERKQNKKN